MTNKPRAPIRAIGVHAARTVRSALGYAHPMDIEIEIIAYMRGALVRRTPVRGARANLVRLGDRAIIGISDGLSFEEQRWAIAHELGHFEAHAGVSFLGLCTGTDMTADYQASGREPEANAFAAELLMPEDLLVSRCDVASVSWAHIVNIADEFAVSVMAASLRFVSLTPERVAVVCARRGTIEWVTATKDFGGRPRKGAPVEPWTEARAFFDQGVVEPSPQTVSAEAWVADANEDEHLIEHVFPMDRLGIALSLLWRKS